MEITCLFWSSLDKWWGLWWWRTLWYWDHNRKHPMELLCTCLQSNILCGNCLRDHFTTDSSYTSTSCRCWPVITLQSIHLQDGNKQYTIWHRTNHRHYSCVAAFNRRIWFIIYCELLQKSAESKLFFFFLWTVFYVWIANSSWQFHVTVSGKLEIKNCIISVRLDSF